MTRLTSLFVVLTAVTALGQAAEPGDASTDTTAKRRLPGTTVEAEPAPSDSKASRRALRRAAKSAKAAPRVDLSGEWRLFLPAGFERTVTILDMDDDRRITMQPASLNLGGTYEVRGDRLVSVGVDGGDPGRREFEWRIRSPYMLVLEKGTRSFGPDYTSAVLFRAREKQATGSVEESEIGRP